MKRAFSRSPDIAQYFVDLPQQQADLQSTLFLLSRAHQAKEAGRSLLWSGERRFCRLRSADRKSAKADLAGDRWTDKDLISYNEENLVYNSHDRKREV